jgi:hypothetical protein
MEYFEKKTLEDKKITWIGFKLEGDFEGYIILQHSDKVIRFLETTIPKLTEVSDEKIDKNMLIQTNLEFYNIIIPTFTEVIKKTLNTSFKFTKITMEDISKIYNTAQSFNNISLTNVCIRIGREDIEVKTHIYFQTIPEQVKQTFN